MSGKMFDELAKLVEELTAALAGQQQFILGIDGFPGAGKTTTAKELSIALDASHIELDTYSNKTHFDYVQCLDLARIRRDIYSDRAVIEGARLLEIIELLNISVNNIVYIKRYTKHNMWAERVALESSQFDEMDIDPFDLAIIKYHKKHLPHTKANYTFCRKNC